jgi:hypothetical protein
MEDFVALEPSVRHTQLQLYKKLKHFIHKFLPTSIVFSEKKIINGINAGV